MRKQWRHYWKWMVWLCVCLPVMAYAVSNPQLMLKSVTSKMFVSMDRNLRTLKGPRGNVYIHDLVKRVLMPHININRMATAVVGRRYWKQATRSQRASFITQFAKTVISTYSVPLKSYNKDRLRFYPLRTNYQKTSYINVRSLLIRQSGQRIPITYNLSLVNGRWKVYDFSIENISITQSFRAQFASTLASQGFSGLLRRLRQHNKNF